MPALAAGIQVFLGKPGHPGGAILWGPCFLHIAPKLM